MKVDIIFRIGGIYFDKCISAMCRCKHIHHINDEYGMLFTMSVIK